mgnify:CR=1 FL=1
MINSIFSELIQMNNWCKFGIKKEFCYFQYINYQLNDIVKTRLKWTRTLINEYASFQ